MKAHKIKILLAVIVCTLLTRLLAKANFAQLIASLKQVKLSLLALLLALQVLTELLLVWQWCRLARLMGLPAPFHQMLFINAQGTVMESITPSAKVGGEVVRALLMKERLGYTTNQSTALIAMQKVISVGALVVINLLVLLVFSSQSPILANHATRLGLLVTMALLLGLFWLLLLRTDWLVARLGKSRNMAKWFAGLKKWVADFADYTRLLRGQHQKLLSQFLLALVIWGVFPAKLVLLVRPFGVRGAFLMLVATTLVSYFVAMIPISPGGLGSFEVTMTSMLVGLGLTAEQSLSASLTFRFITFWFVVAVSLGLSILDNVRLYSTTVARTPGSHR